MTINNLDNFYTCQNIVMNECFCSWQLFKENVTNEMSYQSFLDKLDECNSKSEIRKLVNQFI